MSHSSTSSNTSTTSTTATQQSTATSYDGSDSRSLARSGLVSSASLASLSASTQSTQSSAALTLAFANVQAHVPGRQVLFSVAGAVQGGQLTMLMGASGAGKTTLFDILSHRPSNGLKYSGDISLNGEPFDLDKFHALAAYVTQDSFLFACLTVRESLQFQADLQLSGTLSASERRARVNEALHQLHLASYADKRVSALNVATRKKLSIGMALLTNPSVLFCDEPTTGLDASTARDIVTALRHLAHERGIIVFCTIHQPSVHVFNSFDAALVMALGTIAYAGPVRLLLPALAAIGQVCPAQKNPADFVISLLATAGDSSREKRVRALIADLRGTSTSAAGASERDMQAASAAASGSVAAFNRKRPSYFRRVSALFVRNIRATLRSEMALAVNVGQAIVFGLIFGFIFWRLPRTPTGFEDRMGFFFLVVSNEMFLGIQNAINPASTERAIFLAEHASGAYGTSEYLLARLVAQVPFSALYPAVFSAVCYFMIGLRDDAESFGVFVLLLALLNLGGNMWGLGLSILCGDLDTANVLSASFGFPWMLFSGYVVATENIVIWLRWLRYLSMVYYSLNPMIVSQLSGLTAKCAASGSCEPGLPSSGDEFIALLKSDENGRALWRSVLPMVALIVGGLVCTYAVMVWQAWRSKTRARL